MHQLGILLIWPKNIWRFSLLKTVHHQPQSLKTFSISPTFVSLHQKFSRNKEIFNKIIYLITHCIVILCSSEFSRTLVVTFISKIEMWLFIREKEAFLTCFWHTFQNSSFLVHFLNTQHSTEESFVRSNMTQKDLPRKNFSWKLFFILFFLRLTLLH